MSQYVIDPFDPHEETAINLIQPNERSYPVVSGLVRQDPDNGRYIVSNNDRETPMAVIEADGVLPGVVAPHQYHRRLVLSPEDGSEKILAIETGVDSKTFIAVRPHGS